MQFSLIAVLPLPIYLLRDNGQLQLTKHTHPHYYEAWWMVVAFGIFLIDCMTAELSVLEIILRSLIVTGKPLSFVIKTESLGNEMQEFFWLSHDGI